MLLSSFLLAFNPANQLIPVKDQSAAGLEPEVRKPSWNEGLPYGPRTAADHFGDLVDVERTAELSAERPENGLRRPQDWPVLREMRA